MSPGSSPSSTAGNELLPLEVSYRKVTSIAEAFNLPEPAIFRLAKADGLDVTKARLRLHLSVFASEIHVKDTFTPSDIDFVVEELATNPNYCWLKLADLSILFRRIRMNYYGKLYQSMNTGMFFDCLDRYCIERNREIERLRDQENQQRRLELKNVKLSYLVNSEGRLEYTPERKAYEAEKQRQQAEIEDETRRKRQVQIEFILAKPDNERTEKEKRLLEQYQQQ